jgi:tripartite ATP-independent transporter DctP family solute receptor
MNSAAVNPPAGASRPGVNHPQVSHPGVSHLGRRTILKAGAAAVCAPYVAGARAAVDLRLTHPADVSHPVHLEAEKMAVRIAERTGGAVKITIFPNNALGSPVETAQQTRLGAIDMILMNPANIEAISKTIGVINIPYQFDGYEHAHRTLDVTARPWIEQQLATAGFSWIANFEWGFRALSNSRRPVNTPEDVSGMKIRVPPELAIKAAFEALGANTQTVAFQEVYLALANKTVDGQDNPIGTTFAAKFFEVQSHIALTRHIYASIMFAANPRTWKNKLDEKQREIVSSEATAAGAAARKAIRDQEEAYLTRMQQAGIAITRPDVAPFRARMGPAYDVLRKNLGDDTWNTWTKLVAAARA